MPCLECGKSAPSFHFPDTVPVPCGPRTDYLGVNGSSGLRVFNDIGPPAQARVEGASLVCNAVDGAVVANTSTADFEGGALGSPGDNAFTQNNLPGKTRG